MINKFTSLDLIRFIYNEMDMEERLLMIDFLENDPWMMHEYIQLKRSYDKLPRVSWSAPQTVVEEILDYSKNSAFEPMS